MASIFAEHVIKLYDSAKVGIGAIIAPAAKNATSRNTILKTFYVTKITFTEYY